MASRRRVRWVLWLVLAGAAAAAWQLAPRFLQRRAGTERLVNQVWVERAPNDERDLVGFLFLLEKDDRRQGGLGRASRWRSHTEGLVWRLAGNVLQARFPQNQRNARVQVRTWRCAGEAPRPFEWCLEVKANEHARRYFSRDAWRIRPHDAVLDDDARAELPWVASALRPLDTVPAEEPAEPSDGDGEAPLETTALDELAQ